MAASELRLNIPSLEIPGLTIKRLPDGKVLFKKEGDACHYTLHPGRESGFLDIHKTWEPSSRHEEIFRIAWSDVAKILTEISADLPGQLRALLEPIRVGWMARRRLGILIMTDETRAGDFTCIKLRDAEATQEELERLFRVPEYLDELRSSPHCVAHVYDCRESPPVFYGCLFTIPVGDEAVALRWVKLKDMYKFMRQFEQRLRKAYERVVGKPFPVPAGGPLSP